MSTPRALCCLLSILFGTLSVSAAQNQSQNAVPQPAQNALTCFPAPCVLPTVQASGGFLPPLPVSDATIVADPSHPNHLLVGNGGDGCTGNQGPALAHYSTDGGSLWTDFCMSPYEQNYYYWYPSSDPLVGFDRNGTAYLFATYYYSGQGQCSGVVGFQKSNDGLHWTQPKSALSGNYCAEPEYPSLAVDTNADSPWVNTVYYAAAAGNENGELGIVVTHSSDGGMTWKKVSVDRPQGDSDQFYFTSMTVGRGGTVYVTWLQCDYYTTCNNSGVQMMFSKSTDNGNTWSTPTVLATVTTAPTQCQCPLGDLPNTNPQLYVNNFPVIGVDNSNGPFAGSLYVVMYTWTGTYMQVEVARSTDDGNTWSAPVAVAPPGATHDQFMPNLSVSNTGAVGVMWLDRRNDLANHSFQPFGAISTDGGLSFQPNVPLLQAFTNPNLTRDSWLGDYNGSTWAGSNFLAAWKDASNGAVWVDLVGGIRQH